MFSNKDLPIKNNQSFLNYQQYHIYIYISVLRVRKAVLSFNTGCPIYMPVGVSVRLVADCESAATI